METTYDAANPPPAKSDKELSDPDFMMRSLHGLMQLEPVMQLSAHSRDDATRIIVLQVLFLTGGVLTAIRNSQIIASYPNPMHGLVGVIGCGLIGSAVLDGLLGQGLPPESIMVASRDKQKVKRYTSFGCLAVDDAELVQTCKIIVICVAPQHLRGLGNQIRKVGSGSSLVISTVAGVSATKLSKLLGLSRVIRTFVDLVQLPVEWGPDGPPEDLMAPDAITASAKNFVAEKGVLQLTQGGLESLCSALGLKEKEARYEATYAVVGDGDIGEDILKKSKSEWGEDEDHCLRGLEGYLREWRASIATGFFDVFAEEVFVKDLPGRWEGGKAAGGGEEKES